MPCCLRRSASAIHNKVLEHFTQVCFHFFLSVSENSWYPLVLSQFMVSMHCETLPQPPSFFYPLLDAQIEFSKILLFCHTESWAWEAQAWAAHNVHIITVVLDTVFSVIIVDADTGSVDTVCCQNLLSHQKQEKKNWEEVWRGNLLSKFKSQNAIISGE